MSDDTRLNEVIAEALGIGIDEVSDALEFESIPQWDSMGHVALITALETEFETTVDDAMMVELTTVKAIRTFIRER